VDGAATGSIGVGDRRRVRAAPRPVVPRDRPEEAFLGAAATWIKHWRRRFVDRDLAGGQDEFAQPQPQRLELRRSITDPERQHRAFNIDALCEQHLGLPVERRVVGILGDQHMGDHRFGRQPALDQPLRRGRLHHAIRAGPARIFGTMRHDHPELRRDDVEPPGRILADDVHRGAAAGTAGVFRRDRHVDMRQMGRKRAALGAASVGACPGSGRVLPVCGRRVAGDGLLDVLERQLQLLGIELLRTAAELRTLQLAQQVPQPVILRQRLVALRTCGSEERLQRVDVVGKLIRRLAHAWHSTRFGCCRGAREAA
jgi:hypothetical protein